jgi:hypothetical protein
MMTEFTTQKAEMHRRKRAFESLSLSFFLAFSLSLLLFADFRTPSLFASFCLPTGLLLLTARLLLVRTLNQKSGYRAVFNDRRLSVGVGKSMKTCDLSEVNGIVIKKTLNNTIRQITLRANDGVCLRLDGFKDFDRIEKTLQMLCATHVSYQYIREPIDFDHPLFYWIFGTICGIVPVLFVLFLNYVDMDIRTFYGIGAFFLGAYGGFFLLKRPLTDYSVSQFYRGPSKRIADYLIGAALILAGVVLFLKYMMLSI